MLDNLFQFGHFVLHSGEVSDFKIECDALTPEDWLTLAGMIGSRCHFGSVVGIPRGGVTLVSQLRSFTSSWSSRRLVVDDVWTTGASMTPYLDKGYTGYVVFARSPILDPRCRALFTLDAPPCDYTDKMVEASA